MAIEPGSGSGEAAEGVEQGQVVTWGPVLDDDTITLNFPSPSTDWVKVKRYITELDDSLASDAAVQDGMKVLNRDERRKVAKAKAKGADAGTTQIYFRSGTYRLVILRQVVRAWSFLNRTTGQPIPVNADTIARLPVHTRDFIMERIDEMNPQLADKLAEDEDDEEGGEGSGPLSSLDSSQDL